MEANEKMVFEALVKEGKPVRPGDVAKITGIDKEEIAKILGRLKKQGLIDSPQKCFYAPVKK